MQILNVKEKTPKHIKKWIWEGLGLNLGGGWDALGRLLAALGRLLLTFLTFPMMFFSSMGPRLTPRHLLDQFWEGLGRIWGGFGEGLGRNFEGCGRFCVGFGQILDAFGKMWPCCGKAYKLDPRADPRSVTIMHALNLKHELKHEDR